MSSTELLNSHDEKELLAKIATGDQDAFTRIYHAYAGRIYTVAITYLEQESEADELMQEIFIKVWDKREKLDSIDNFKSWLFITARNTIYDHFRRERSESKRRLIFSSAQSDTTDDTSHRVEDRQYAKILEEAISQLPPQRKKVYEYTRMEGLSPAEIGQRMGISKHTVKNQLKSANQFIWEYVKDHLDLLLIAAIFLSN
jgi:RNA polymerase sigma-70 factor (family 1)